MEELKTAVVPAVGPNYGTAPGFNMRNGGMLSPHHSSYRLGKSSRSGVTGGGSVRSHIAVSPLGVMGNTGNFQQASGALPQDTVRTPTWNGAGGTPTGAGPPGDASNPFSWAPGQDGASAPLSAPLSTPLSQQFTDAAHKVVHDEVMKVSSHPRGCILHECTRRITALSGLLVRTTAPEIMRPAFLHSSCAQLDSLPAQPLRAQQAGV